MPYYKLPLSYILLAAEESEGGVQEDIAAEESKGGVQEDIAAEESKGGVQEDIPPETPTLAELKNNSEIPSLELAGMLRGYIYKAHVGTKPITSLIGCWQYIVHFEIPDFLRNQAYTFNATLTTTNLPGEQGKPLECSVLISQTCYRYC